VYQKYYSHFLKANAGIQHYCAHSHHYWPDVTLEAQIQYWHDSAKWVDDKWENFFAEVLPQVQTQIAHHLNLRNKSSMVFAPNTHELVYRLISSVADKSKRTRILTTDSEFYSFDRQINRWSELEGVEVVKVPTEPFATFTERFSQAMSEGAGWDLIFFSQVFFNSGFVCDWQTILKNIPTRGAICMDGYHGFMAIPTDLSPFEGRLFYVSGGYKYAQGGEGACFMVVPQDFKGRPLNTGWFAEIGNLEKAKDGQVAYPSGAQRLIGSTMDFTALYRMRASLELFAQQKIEVFNIHHHVQDQQKLILKHLNDLKIEQLSTENLVPLDWSQRGHFLTFQMKDEEQTQSFVRFAKSNKIWFDSRGSRLRLGLGLYHNGGFDLGVLKSWR
jgi:selenocysteine lyase/cysteine desulfurase